MQSRKRSLEGYPLKAYAFVRENPGDDRDLLLSKNTVCLADKDTVISSRQDEYRVQYCYGSESTSQGISARTIQPLLRQLMEGYNVALLLVSSRGSDGTNLLLGKTTANWTGVTDDAAGGLVHEAAKALFDVLHEKCLHIDEQLAMQRIHPVAGGLQYAVESTFLQICGEEGCRDLHAPGNACYLQRCPRMLPGGFDFTGLKTRPAYEAQDLVHAFMQGTSDASLLSVGVDGQEHGLIFSIHLTQHAASDVPDRDPVELVSHMLIAVLPSLWTSLPNSVTTSGNAPQASKMLHTLTSTLYALACGDHELATSTIRSSYMMQLLSENLTGNCVTAFLGLLRQGQGAMSRAVLDVLQMAQMVHSTPIANTGAAQGLLQRLRTAISKVEAHGAQALTWSGTGQNDPVLTAAKLEKMGGRLREALLEREGLEAQKGELQSERDSLQVEKEGLQEQLVASEESVLQLTRSLLDLRLEFNSVRDMLESEEYKTEKRASAGLLNGDELNSRELTELAELRGKMEENNKRCRREAEELQAALAEVSAAADQEAAEASSARASLHECRRNYLARIQHLILQVGDMGRAVELAGGDSKSAFCPRKEGFLGLARELAAHVLAVWTDAQDESRQQLELLETRHSTLRRHLRALLSAYHQLRYRLEEAGEHVQDGRQQFSEATLDSLLQQEENVARELLAEMRDKVSLLTRMLQEQRLLQSTHGQEENGAFSQDDLLLLQLNGMQSLSAGADTKCERAGGCSGKLAVGAGYGDAIEAPITSRRHDPYEHKALELEVELLRQALDEMHDTTPGEAYAAVLQDRDMLRERVRELEMHDPSRHAQLVKELADAKARLTRLRREPGTSASPLDYREEHAKESQRLEKELAAATMRATVAEAQLEVTQQYVAQSILAHQKEIFRLQELLEQAGLLADGAYLPGQTDELPTCHESPSLCR